MPRPRTLDHAAILAAVETIGSMRAAAKQLGVHYNTVYSVVHRANGACARCGKTGGVLSGTMCDPCKAYMAAHSRNQRSEKQAIGICARCDKPIEPPSTWLCTDHRLMENAQKRRLQARPNGREERLARGRDWNRKYKYGEASVDVWNEINATCAICGAAYQPRRSHLHHIDRDHANRSRENLIVLCASCHHLVHSLGAHNNPQLVLDWYLRTYGAIRPLAETG